MEPARLANVKASAVVVRVTAWQKNHHQDGDAQQVWVALSEREFSFVVQTCFFLFSITF